jgi:site-specific DNA-cytosine methylase
VNELSLFSGAGGGLLGSKLRGWRTVGYVERDEYGQRVLRARIIDGFLDDTPIFPDVRTFSRLRFRGRVDIVTAGFPCQPFSSTARGRNVEQSLWNEADRIILECGPRFCFIENVAEVAGVSATSSPIWTEVDAEDLRVAHEVAYRMERLTAAGIGQVPRVVVEARNRLK